MASEVGFPQMMVHPQHQSAVVRDFNSSDGLPGAPERFPPVEVHSADQEEALRAKGYLRYGEQMPKVAEFSEFPKMMHHPDHVDAIPPTMGVRVENGNRIEFQIPGIPAKFPPAIVRDALEQAGWEARGYIAPGVPGAEAAFERATLAPGKPGDEWPKWVDGVLTQDPDAPPDITGQYPKWLHFEGGDSVLVSDAAHEARVLESRGVKAEPEKQPDKPYLPEKAADPDYAEFLAWKAQREAATAPEPVVVDKDAEERSALLALAEETGVEVDKRWGLKRLREAVMGAEAAH